MQVSRSEFDRAYRTVEKQEENRRADFKVIAPAAAALLALSPAAALAHDYNNTADTQYVQTEEEHGFPLGLLGLAGLLGGRKISDRDIHVDNRRETR